MIECSSVWPRTDISEFDIRCQLRSHHDAVDEGHTSRSPQKSPRITTHSYAAPEVLLTELGQRTAVLSLFAAPLQRLESRRCYQVKNSDGLLLGTDFGIDINWDPPEHIGILALI